jgi:digeranylgeranylglycerophospholipid reductase
LFRGSQNERLSGQAVREVIVVGAGPAGLYTALGLAKAGLDVVVVEEHAEVGVPTHCTGIVSAETNSLYEIPESIVLNRPSSCLVISPGGVVAELADPGEGIAVLDRAGLDRALATSVQTTGGLIRAGFRVDHVRTSDRFVEVESDRGERLRARALVLACGVTFRFHALLGARLPSRVLHTAQIELVAAPAEKLEVYVGREVAPDGFAWLVPLRRGDTPHVKAGVLMRGAAQPYLEKFLARPSIAERLRQIPGEPTRRLLPMTPIARSYADRIVAVGDAAGLTKPVTGGGIFYSLMSAQIAADTLIDALAADHLSAARLAQYEARWRKRLMPEIRAGRRLRDCLERLDNREWDTLVTALGSDEVQSLIHRKARFNWHSPVIFSMLKRPGIRSLLLRSFFR